MLRNAKVANGWPLNNDWTISQLPRFVSILRRTVVELKAGHNAILHGKTTDLRQDVYQVEQLISRNGNIHKPAMPTQGVLVLAESTDSVASRKLMPHKPVNCRRQDRF